MNYTISEVLQYVMENDVKFVRLCFCDIFGTLKNISIIADELPRAFDSGISFDASSINGFLNIEESDLFLYPDPDTISILPWRPQQGRVARFFCDIKYYDGRPFEGDCRFILKNAINAAAELDYKVEIGSECEFYLFELNEKGNPTKNPHDHAGYFDMAPLDKGENVRRDICLNLEQMGIIPESSHHEQGPGQNEIDFKYSDSLSAAENLVTFRSVVKTIAQLNGLHASFMPKPLKDNGGSGLHINMSILKNGINLFDNMSFGRSQDAESFVSGILNRIREITVFLNPLTNSYERFGSHSAPKYITWSSQNRSQLIRLPAASGKYSRMEIRSADPCCNPYLTFALLIYAGLEGIKKGLKLCAPENENLYDPKNELTEKYEMIPDTLNDAINLAASSDFVKNHLPDKTLEKYIAAKQAEWNKYAMAENKEEHEQELYFYVF